MDYITQPTAPRFIKKKNASITRDELGLAEYQAMEAFVSRKF